MMSPIDPQTTSTTSASPTNSVLPLRLRFRGGQHDGQVVRINSNKCTIGSAPNATLRLACAGVHPVHCLIMSGTGGTIIRSMAPDTLLNGETFEDAHLNSGDTLTVGPLHLQVIERSEPASTSPAAPAHDEPANRTNAVVEELTARIESLEATNQQLVGKLEDLSSRYEVEVTARAEELEARRAEDAARKEQESNQDNTQAEFQQLREQLAQFESLSEEKQNLAAQFSSLHEHVQQAELVQAQGKADSKAAAEQLAAFEAMKVSHENLSREVVTLQKQMDQAEDYCTKWESQHQQLESDFAAANLVSAEKDNELQALRAKLANNGEGSEDQWAAERQQLQEQLQYAQSQIAQLGQQPAPALQPIPAPAAVEFPQVEAVAPAQPEPPVSHPTQTMTMDDFNSLSDQMATAPAPAAPAAVEFPQVEAVAPAQPEPPVSHPTQTITMDDFNSLSDQMATAPAAPAFVGTNTVSQTMIFEEGQAFETTPQDSAMSMLDKLRAELGTPARQPAEPEPLPTFAADRAPVADPAFEPAPAAPIATQEEIIYAEPDSAAPVDTAAILAKFGHSMEDLPEDSPAPTLETRAPEPVALEEEDSIQDYMAQLMQRVGSEEGPVVEQKKKPVVTQTVKPVVQSAAPKITPNPAAAAATAAVKPLDPSEFVPRAVAPEASGGLKALRAVANTSTRSAIDRHQRRSLDSKAVLSGLVALVSFGICVAMGYLAFGNENFVSLPTLLCLSSGIIGLLAAVKALAFSARSALGSRRQQNLKQLSAR